MIVLNAGSGGVAFGKVLGRLLWKSGPAGAGYSTPIAYSRGNDRFAALFVEAGIVAVNLNNGAELWRHEWRTEYDVNAADPIIVGDRVFISSGYDRGCALLQTASGKVSVLWENKELRNQCNPSVLVDGFLYGFDGDVGPNTALKCVEFATGKTKWSQANIGAGALMAADGKLIILSHRGELIIADASPTGYKELSRAQALGGTGWVAPVLANGKIYCRNSRGDLVCVDVSGKGPSRASGE
jgi:outer membrane protein assembly factor BamB